MKKTILGLALAATQMAGAQSYLKFSEACSQEENIEIMAVGDILLHSPLAIQAASHPKRFQSLWELTIPALERADLAYGNLEGPAAAGVLANGSETRDSGHVFDNRVYTSYPMFNYHPSLISDLAKSGIDIVSTANNHSLDRRALGVDRTIEALEKERMPFTGTKSTRNMDQPWHTVTRVKGRNIAWLACTFSTNGIRDDLKQVLPCYENPNRVLNLIRNLASQRDIDAVIVTPHWGNEYQHKPHDNQIWLGRNMIEAGATAVLGTHPHVIQPWEKHITADGREGFIIYSTGNFVSGQPPLPRRVSVMVQLNLVAGKSQKMKIRGVQYLPLYMQKSQRGYEVLPVYSFDQNIPAEAVKIWKMVFNDQHRITSLDESSPQKICQLSQSTRLN